MNQSASYHHQNADSGKLSAGQSLEREELRYFDWGVGEGGGADEERVFVDGSGSGAPPPPPAQQQQATAAVENQHQCHDDPADQWSPIPFRSQETNDNAIFGFSRQNYMEGIRAWSSGGFLGGAAAPAAAVASPLPAKADEAPPGMVRSSSGSLSSDSDSALGSDDDMSEDSSGGSDRPIAKGVSFNEQVRVLPIPPLAAYTHEQRGRMYANRFEQRENKLRAKKEYEFDGFDWRNATEEHSMAICPVSGELLHPAHL